MFARLIAVVLSLAAAVLLSATAHASDVTVTIRDDKGRPVADAVVTIAAPSGVVPRPGKYTIDQKNMQFLPFVLVIPVGSTVEFTNLDPFRHHVYSFSPAKKFELKLFGEGEARPVKFDKLGVVAIGCNIHDSMQAFIQVVDTPFAVRSGANGRAVVRGVPAGSWKLTVWHPRLRAPGNQITLTVDARGDVSVPVSVKLRAPPPMQHDY